VGRGAKIAIATLVTLALLAGAGWAYDSSQRETVAKGVSVAGVDIGELNRAAATAKLRSELGPRLEHPVKVSSNGQTFVLTPAQAGARIDYSAAVNDALERSRRAWIGERLWRLVSGDPVHASVSPGLQLSGHGVSNFVHRIAGKLNRAPVEAHLSFGPDSVSVQPGSPGAQVDAALLAAQVRRAMTEAPSQAPASIGVSIKPVQPTTGSGNLASKYPTAIIVNRSNFTLKLFKDLKLAKTYRVAVGMAGLETPSGLYSIQDMQTNPSWHVPNSSWAGALAGKTIPPGPADPIKARWMGLAAGVGIHGTAADSSLGSAASHGCVRMNVSDVIDLYNQVSVGTPVYIV
jgi:lipoprotein-anchoring transpeptidase ErfK/SrfK